MRCPARSRGLLFLVMLAIVASGLLAAGVAARADEPKDAAGLLELARTVETVERDTARALAIYKRASEAPGGATASRDALIAMARLLEEMGRAEEALAALVAATERYGNGMDDATKLRVHEAMGRLVPPGGVAESPLSRIHAPRAGLPVPARSPLDEKIRTLLSRVDQPTQNDYAVRQEIHALLSPVGRDALPVLERLMFEERPERAALAAELFARIGGVDAIPGLERAIREGDGFTRDAALKALGHVPSGDAAKGADVAALDRLLADPRLSSVAVRLQDLLRWRVAPPGRLERYRRGGPFARSWLEAALQGKAPGALEVALDVARSGGSEAPAALGLLLPLIFRSDGRAEPLYPPGTLDAPALHAFLEMLLSGKSPEESVAQVGQLLEALRDRGGVDAVQSYAERAWRLLPRSTERHRRRVVVEALLPRVEPPRSLFDDPEWADAYFDTRVTMPSNLGGWEPPDAGPWWEAFLRSLSRELPAQRKREMLVWLQGALQNRSRSIPREYDARWVPFVDPNVLPPGHATHGNQVLLAAARSGRPEFLAAIRRHMTPEVRQAWGNAFPASLLEYHGPGLLDLVRELLSDPDLSQQELHVLFSNLAENTGPEGQAEILRMARDWQHPRALEALARAGPAISDRDLVEIGTRVMAAPEPPGRRYRGALVQLIQSRNLREGVPYLLWEFRRSELSDSAGKALDAIRAYHDKITEFEAWSRDVRGGSSSDPVTLLAHPSAEVRRAAAITLGALRLRSALPALARAGAEDPDPAVREAALAAVAAMR